MKLQESKILREIVDALGRVPRVLVRRRTVGIYLAVSCKPSAAVAILRAAGIAARPVQVNIPGEPDLDVLVGGQVCPHCGGGVWPRPVGLEVKTEAGRESSTQINYRERVAAMRGIPHAVVRNVAEARAACGLEG